MFWRLTNQDFNTRLMDVTNELVFLEKYSGLLAGVSFPPSSRVSRVSLAPKIPFPFPFKRSRRLLCTTARRTIIFVRTALSCLCCFSKSGGRNNAKYAFQYTFKHCLKMTPHNMKKRRWRNWKEQSMDLHDHIRGGSPIQFRQGLIWLPQLNRVARG